MGALPQILPQDVADYHVSRARCSKAAKRARKAAEGKAKGAEGPEGGAAAAPAAPQEPLEPVPAEALRPEILDHLVLGLNEVIKALEHATADLEAQLIELADAIEGVPSLPRFLPTEPAEAAEPEAVAAVGKAAAAGAPLAHVLVPHLSVSPMALVDPIPALCATYNTHVRQLRVLAQSAPAGAAVADVAEIRLVSLGKEEAEVAALAGLRRVACFAVRASHPNAGVLSELCKNIAPPRHSITLPFPTRLRVIDGGAAGAGPGAERTKGTKGTKGQAGGKLPDAQVQYAPLHVKALHTTAPLDNNARKAVRLDEVRRVRAENKAKRRQAREALEHKVRLDLGHARGKGRKARLAAKAAKAAKVPKPRTAEPATTK